jgi:hypothetical protein
VGVDSLGKVTLSLLRNVGERQEKFMVLKKYPSCMGVFIVARATALGG